MFSTPPLLRRLLALLAVGMLAAVACAQPPGWRGPNPGGSGAGPGSSGGVGPNFGPPGGQIFENVWTCSRCGKELGRGPTPPNYTTCPFCGAHFINGGFGALPPAGGSAPGNFNPPPANSGFNPLPGNSGNNPPPANSGNGPQPFQPAPNPPPADSGPPIPPAATIPYTPPSAPAASLGTVVLGVGVIMVGLAVLGGAACLIIISVAKSNKPRRRRYRRYEDDEY